MCGEIIKNCGVWLSDFVGIGKIWKGKVVCMLSSNSMLLFTTQKRVWVIGAQQQIKSLSQVGS